MCVCFHYYHTPFFSFVLQPTRHWREMKALLVKLVIHPLLPSSLCIWIRLRRFLWVKCAYPPCPHSCSAQSCFLCVSVIVCVCVWLNWGWAVTNTCLTFLFVPQLLPWPITLLTPLQGWCVWPSLTTTVKKKRSSFYRLYCCFHKLLSKLLNEMYCCVLVSMQRGLFLTKPICCKTSCWLFVTLPWQQHTLLFTHAMCCMHGTVYIYLLLRFAVSIQNAIVRMPLGLLIFICNLLHLLDEEGK